MKIFVQYLMLVVLNREKLINYEDFRLNLNFEQYKLKNEFFN